MRAGVLIVASLVLAQPVSGQQVSADSAAVVAIARRGFRAVPLGDQPDHE